MKVRVTRPAEADLSALVDYISRESPRSAAAVLDRILACLERLGAYPEIGHDGRVPGTRELTVARTPYIVVHRRAGGEVIVLRVRHAAQQWPPQA